MPATHSRMHRLPPVDWAQRLRAHCTVAGRTDSAQLPLCTAHSETHHVTTVNTGIGGDVHISVERQTPEKYTEEL